MVNRMSAANWHLPSVSTRTKSCAVAAADFQHPLKVQGAQKWDALCWCRGYWGHWQNRSSDMSGADFISPIVSPHMEKSTKILHSDNCWSWLAESFMRLAETLKNGCLTACTHPSPESYILSFPPTTSGAVFQSYLRCCLSPRYLTPYNSKYF